MSEPGNPLVDALDNPVEVPRLAEPGDRGLDSGSRERPPFPLGCPIKPLGMMSGIGGSQCCFYLDWNGQIVGLEAGNRHGKNSLIALFGPSSDWLEENFPQWSAPQYEGRGKDRRLVKESEIVGFDQAEASRALIEECARKGIFDPSGRMRGRGAHRIGENGLALHCGDGLLVSVHKVSGEIRAWEWTETGLHAGFVYPAAAPIPRPHHEHCDTKAAEKVLAVLQTWNWKRKLLDARFALGWIGASFIGGALDWRPTIWITGGAGTGKSTLNGDGGFILGLLGDGVFHTGNASAAAIRQSLKNSTVPVMFDEIEASEDNRRVKEVIELARLSSSGAAMHRGGQDHAAHEFTLRSCFQFSSILIPPLEPQDRSRLAFLELKRLPEDAKAPALRTMPLAAWGRALQRRMVDGWARLERTKLKFHEALQLAGHSARACDQFGTLLACADVAINDWDTADGLPDDEEISLWISMCRPDRMNEVSEAMADEEACIAHLVTSMVQARGGEEREAMGSWIGQALDVALHPLLNETDARNKHAKRLQDYGLKLVQAQRTAKGAWGAATYQDPELPAFLAVASSHQGLGAIYAGTKWQGGVWKQSLARTPGAIEGVPMKFGHANLRAVLVPIAAVLDESELNAASLREAAVAWVKMQEGAEA